MGELLLYNDSKELKGIVLTDVVGIQNNYDVLNDCANILVKAKYTEWNWVNCRDAKFFKLSTHQDIMIEKSHVSINAGIINIYGQVSNAVLIGLEVT